MAKLEPVERSGKASFQGTVQAPVFCEGIGVHSGKPARLTFTPALPNTGIVFRRTDIGADFPALWNYVVSTTLCTTLGNDSGATLSTVEHVLAALSALEVDNVLVEIDGPEVPIMDGSAAPFVGLVQEAGILHQDVPRRIIRLLKEVEILSGEKWARLTPASERTFAFDCHFDRPSPFEDQSLSLHLTPEGFCQQIAQARTFGFAEDLEKMRAQGLGKGASLKNAVALAADRVLNPEGLRYDDECVRHKILDAVGDLALAGFPIMGAFSGHRSGHSLNAQLVKKLMTDSSCYRIEEIL